MNILLPMAGAGSRFANKGFKQPKPLIPVDGVPMVVKAVNDLPKADKHIFICRDEHIQQDNVGAVLSSSFKGVEIVSIDYLTEGQASTCLLAKDYINNDEELIIAACDNGMIYDQHAFEKAKENFDVIAFTFRNNVTVCEKPDQYGWYHVNEENEITGTSIKKAISNTPMKDHAVVGAFWFRQGAYFVASAEKMIQENRRINQEFYVDECLKDAIDLGLKVGVFEIDHYLCWGTPDDYETYHYWNKFFAQLSN